MYVIVWRFTARDAAEFERHYRADGTWAQLFRRSAEYIRTDLLRGDDGSYLTLDWWASRDAYDAFREASAEEYAEIDRICAGVTIDEEEIGRYFE